MRHVSDNNYKCALEVNLCTIIIHRRQTYTNLPCSTSSTDFSIYMLFYFECKFQLSTCKLRVTVFLLILFQIVQNILVFYYVLLLMGFLLTSIMPRGDKRSQ